GAATRHRRAGRSRVPGIAAETVADSRESATSQGREASELLFDLRVLFQAVDVDLEFLLHDAVGQLSLHLIEGCITGVFELDDVPAVLGLHGFGRDLAFLQSLDRIAERLDHARRRKPTEIPALRLR